MNQYDPTQWTPRPGMRHGRLVNFFGRGEIGVLTFEDHRGSRDVAFGDRAKIVNLVRMVAGEERALGKRFLYSVDSCSELLTLDNAEEEVRHD
ncbi:MAG: hypothetical protein FJ280_27745 [Planctomycetes bacterium]|nr:hypothetical protein [Planctomycetota bacterium]